jgi:CHASE3 domain sensor protein
MAEIKIEKKSSNWLWLLLAFIVIAGIVAYFGLTRTDDEGQQTTTVATSDTTSNNIKRPVAEYIEFVNNGRSMGIDHDYTNGALLRLTAAINAKAQQTGYNVSADLDKVKEHADRITQDPFETTHANSIRKAADKLADAMQNMQQAKYPKLTNELNEVRTAANNIKPDVLTLDQRDAVKSFFQASAELIKNMN